MSARRILIAPDSFKGSLAADEVATALAAGWRSVCPADELIMLPQADGGEGTADAISASVPGAHWLDTPTSVSGPDGRPVPGRWLALPDGTAVVEVAATCGLPMLAELDPAGATTRGLGEVIGAALDASATAVCVALGGSAATDGGAGALAGLGLRLLDGQGSDLPRGGAALARLDRIDATGLRPPPPGGVELLTDTTAVLTGPHGAAHVFGPQKGATPELVDRLDQALARFGHVLATVLPADPDRPGAGAAGGTGFGLAAWGGRIVDGATRVAELTGLASVLDRCDVVITGEGRFDQTSTTGKLVGSVLDRCARHHVEPVVVAGQLAVAPHGLGIDLSTLAGSSAASLAEPARWLHQAGALAARHLTPAYP
jgi:glycerate kinase